MAEKVKVADVTHYTDRHGQKIKRRWPKIKPVDNPHTARLSKPITEPIIDVRDLAFRVSASHDRMSTLPRSVSGNLEALYTSDRLVKNPLHFILRYAGSDCVDVSDGAMMLLPTAMTVHLNHSNRVGLITTDPHFKRAGLVVLGGLEYHEPDDRTEIVVQLHNVGLQSSVTVCPGDPIARITVTHRFGLNPETVRWY